MKQEEFENRLQTSDVEQLKELAQNLYDECKSQRCRLEMYRKNYDDKEDEIKVLNESIKAIKSIVTIVNLKD